MFTYIIMMRSRSPRGYNNEYVNQGGEKKRMVNQPRSDYDSPWKEALDIYFEPFMAFCFSDAHSDINWERGYETLDTELQEVVRDAETGRRLADKLVKVWLLSGEEALVLVHVEIQGQYDADFGKRMYIYNHRLFDRYDKEVISLAVLGDDDKDWRPTGYGYSCWGFQSSLQFPVRKLLDYQEQWSELEESTNPFAVIIMAHLRTLATRGDSQERLQSKLSIVRRLYERGYTRNQILELLRLIEWMMVLPEDLQSGFKAEMRRYEEERRMPYMTIFERDAKLEILHESVIAALEARFEAVPTYVEDRVDGIKDLELLKQLHNRAITVESVEEFEEVVGIGEEERQMPYMTTVERSARLAVLRENVIEVLETRFEAVPNYLKDRVNRIKDMALLKRLFKRAITVGSVEEFVQVMAGGAAEN